MENIKKIRHTEIDIAKAICIVGMVFVHVYEAFYLDVMAPGSFAEILVNVIQTLVGAPCFMFCMGASIVFSHSTPDQTIKRGFHIFLLAYALNIARFGLPMLVEAIVFKTPFNEFILPWVNELLSIDIMPFAGLALMLVGFLRKINFNEYKIVFVAIALSIIGSFIRGFYAGDYLNYLVGLFLGVVSPIFEDATYFPLFNWFIIVAFGYLFGSILNKSDSKKKTYGILVPICFIITFAYLSYALPRKIGMLSTDLTLYYQLTTIEALMSISSCIVYLGLLYLISFVLPDFFIKLCNSFSRNINRIYCAHWIIVGNVTVFLYSIGIQSLSGMQCFVFVTITILISYAIALYIEKKKIAKV